MTAARLLRGSHHGSQSAGYAYLAMLSALALLSLALAAVGTVWQTSAKREKEQQLLKIGRTYAAAIASYRKMATGSVAMGPPSLQALVLDDRFLRPVRHMRQAYADPINANQPWGLILDANSRIAGVYSTSRDVPMQRSPVVMDGLILNAAQTYSDWKFMAKDTQ